jgi:hypothetical protein
MSPTSLATLINYSQSMVYCQSDQNAKLSSRFMTCERQYRVNQSLFVPRTS